MLFYGLEVYMSTQLGTLTLDLVSRIGNFVGPIIAAENQTRTSFDNMRKHVNTYGTAVASVATGAVTALAVMALDTANQAADLEKFALRANTTTQEFQKMAVGAQAFGIEAETLSGMMKDFNEKLGELTAVGAGGGVDFFEKIAVETEGSAEAAEKLILKMQKLSGPEALQMYVDKLEEAGVTQQQMSFYLESMASDVTDLIPLLVNGGEGMRLYGEMAERAGIIMKDETIESAKILKDQIYMLDLQMQGAKNQLMQAVIPAFIDISEAFFGGSEQGLQFEGVASGIANTLKGMSAVAIGTVTAIQLVGKALGGMVAIGGAILSNKDWYEMGPLGYAKAAYDARDEISALTTEIKADIHGTVMGAAERLDQMWSGGSSKQANQLRGIRELSQTVGQTNGGLSELVDKQNKASEATKENNKALQEQQRLLEQQKQQREQILRTYASDFQNRIWEEEEQQDLVKGSGFSSSEQTKYLALIKKRFNAENAEYFKSLNLEINQFKWSNEKKLAYAYQMDREIAENDVKIADEVREAKLKFLDEQYAIELQKARFHASNMRQAMQESIKGLSSDADNIFAQATMSASHYAQWSLENDRSNAKAGLKNQNIAVQQDIMTSDIYSTDDERYEALLEAYQEYRDGMAAIDVEYAQQVKDLESRQYQDSMQMYGSLLSQAGAVWGDMTQLVKDSQGEQSGSYKAMFLMQQTFAMGSALVSTHLAAVQVMADPTALTPAQKIIYSKLILGMGYANVGIIAGQTIAGMAHDGIDNIPKEGTWLLDKGERVVDSRTNADLKDHLRNVRSQSGGSANIVINVPPGYTAQRSRQGDRDVIDIVERYLGQQIQNPNSNLIQGITKKTTATVRR